MRNAIWVGLAIAAVACSKNVPQDSKTGDDGRNKGARVVKLENDEARTRGIVTYPGGDRVDWKVIELPKDQVGTIDFKLRWTPPRPGLDLSFVVYNQYYRVLDEAKPNTRAKSRKTSKALTIPNAKGKLYVQIYASGRGDAGAYTLTAAWKPTVVDVFDWLAVELPDPPKLPAVPEPEKQCDLAAFDKKLADCQDKCPLAWDATWPPCQNVCPNPPVPTVKACKLCNKDALDPCVQDCRQYYPECDPEKPDATNPKCDGVTRRPRTGEITDIKSLVDGIQLTVNLGTSDGVDKTWEVEVEDAGKRIPGPYKVVTVNRNITIIKTTAAVPNTASVTLKPKSGPAKKACAAAP